MKSRLLLSIIAILLLCSLSLNLTSCATIANAENLMEGIQKRNILGKSADETFKLSQMNFALELLKNNHVDGKNTLLSPFSAMLALSMCANGADGNTLKQMERVLGNNIFIDELNLYLLDSQNKVLNSSDSPLKIANSVWFRSGLDISKNFLMQNADYYSADAFQSAFDDKTKDDINAWVEEKTNGKIPEILDQITPQDMLFLINAIYFEGTWKTKYQNKDIEKGTFYVNDITTQEVEFMKSTENTYLENDKATGFIKPYADGNFSFAAILPNEQLSLEEFLAGTSAKDLMNLLNQGEKATVLASLPKFEIEYSTTLDSALQKMGITDLFSTQADLGKMTEGENNLFVSEVLQKTYLSVDEDGTKAAAVTSVGVKTMSFQPEMKTVHLERPFLYMIIDNSTNLPIFMGTANSVA